MTFYLALIGCFQIYHAENWIIFRDSEITQLPNNSHLITVTSFENDLSFNQCCAEDNLCKITTATKAETNIDEILDIRKIFKLIVNQPSISEYYTRNHYFFLTKIQQFWNCLLI